MSIWEFNLAIKQHSLTGSQFIGNFHKKCCKYMTSGKGRGAYESIIVCIVYLTSVLGSFKGSIVRIAGRVDGLRAAYWTAS